MNRMVRYGAAALVIAAAPIWLNAQTTRTPAQQLARDVYRELIGINTVTPTGDTAKAAQAMAARLRTGGFPAADVQVFTPAPKKGNLVARLRGTGARRPILEVAGCYGYAAGRHSGAAAVAALEGAA